MPERIRQTGATSRANRVSPSAGGGPQRVRSKATTRRKKKGGGFWSDIAEPFTNVGKAIYGIGPGLYEAGEAVIQDVADDPLANPYTFATRIARGENPYSDTIPAKIARGENPFPRTYKRVIKPAGKAYAYKYGSGDLSTTLRRALIEDPLGTALDVGAVTSLGAGAAVKAGVLPSAARSVTLRGPGAAAGQAAKTIERPVVGSELSRRLRLTARSAANRLPYETPLLGEQAAFGRVVRREHARIQAGLELQAVPYLRSGQKLGKKERIAANLLHDYPSRRLLDEYRQSLRGKSTAQGTLRLLSDPKVLKHFDNPTPAMRSYLSESQSLGERGGGLLGVAPETAEVRRFQQALVLRGAKFSDEGLVVPEGKTISSMIDEIRAELQAEGRPEPIYRPHKSVQEKRGIRVGTGGSAPQRLAVYQSHGALAELGRVRYDVDTLRPEFMRSVKHAVYTDRHADLLASGREVPVGTPLPEGWEYVKRRLAEKIPYTERTAGQFEREMAELDRDYARELTTKVETDALTTEGGTRVIVPSRLRQQVIGEFERANNVVARFFRNTTDVWRAMVLNLRVGWLVNNIVGNTLLYAYASAGKGGLRAYLQSVADIRGLRAAVKLIDDPKTARRITPIDMAEILPDQVAGVFFTTQIPTRGGKLLHGRYSPARVLRSVDIAYEQAVRRALANQILRRNPAVKARLKAMPKETRSFRQAAKQEIAENPVVARQVSAQVNNALGDFLGLGVLEQKYLRAAAPFYAWYRAITLVMLKMPLDSPLRAEVLYNLGKIGEGYEAEGYPYGGAIDLGGGAILRTTGANPYATLPQVTESAQILGQATLGGLAPGIERPDPFDVQRAAGLLHPFAWLPFRGRGSLVENLPAARLMFPYQPAHPERGLYSDYGRRAELWQYLGFPKRQLRQTRSER